MEASPASSTLKRNFILLTRRGAFARQTLPWANPG
jgi:hypothetical protein